MCSLIISNTNFTIGTTFIPVIISVRIPNIVTGTIFEIVEDSSIMVECYGIIKGCIVKR